MAVNELLVGRFRRRIVVDAGSFQARFVPLGRRVINGQESQFAGIESQPRDVHRPSGHEIDLAADAEKEATIVLAVLAKPQRPQSSAPAASGYLHAGLRPSDQSMPPTGQATSFPPSLALLLATVVVAKPS